MKTLFLLLAIMLLLGACLLFVRSRKRSSSRYPEPRSGSSVDSQAAAKRALCLASIVLRAQAEYQLQPEPVDSPSKEKIPSDFDSRQNSWLKTKGLWGVYSTGERALFEKALGRWTRQEIADGQWREESFGVLVWALDGSRAFLPYDVPAVQTDVLSNAPSPDASQAEMEPRLQTDSPSNRSSR